MKNKKFKIIIGTLILVAMIATSIAILMPKNSFASDQVVVNDMFENAAIGNWLEDANVVKELVSRGTTDQFMGLIPKTTSSYYLKREFQPTSGIIQADYDINFLNTDLYNTPNTGHFELKYVSGNTNIRASRILRGRNWIYYYTTDGTTVKQNTLLNQNGSTAIIASDVWYHLRIVVNLNEKWQSIYLTNDAKALIGIAEKVPLSELDASKVTQINTMSISCSTKLGIDNVNIINAEIAKIRIAGNPYQTIPVSGSASYTYKAKNASSSGLDLGPQNSTWSIVTPSATGVTIGATTGMLTISSTAKVQPITIKAISLSNPNLSAYYLVDLSK